ncbi:hypothetical protein HYALB_00006547 [Hymenoscyphus albidus]|uniref:Secreted protein n=1 Tax=Hymenoscyphus albidus TaxID=595503 RepID=A0A9N9Q6I1_9HELO|nr:hypothetical protein HYALB_00006547 [Hymenoscyphus albidus]
MRVAQVIVLVTAAFVGVNAACQSNPNEQCWKHPEAKDFPVSFKCDREGEDRASLTVLRLVRLGSQEQTNNGLPCAAKITALDNPLVNNATQELGRGKHLPDTHYLGYS